MTPRHLNTIADAIRERRVLAVEYATPDGRRTVEPHACGWSRQDNALALVYQVRGPSSSGAGEGWKMLRVDRVQSVEILDDRFKGPREDYVRGGHHIPRIMAQL